MTTIRAILVLALAAAAAALECGKVKTVRPLNVTQLRGRWNVVEVLEFENGAPSSKPFSVTVPLEGARLPRCVKVKVKVANETSVCSKAKFFISEDERYTKRSSFALDTQDSGRWLLQSTVPYRQNTEVLVLAADPDKYLALLTCGPEVGGPATSRSALRVAFLSRVARRDVTKSADVTKADDVTKSGDVTGWDDVTEDDDEEVTSSARGGGATGDKRSSGNYTPASEEELQKVRAKVAEALGVGGVTPAKLEVDCFDKKGGKREAN